MVRRSGSTAERPARCSGLPWDVRPVDEAMSDNVSAFGICLISHDALRSLDYALRVTLLSALPLAILTYNDETEWVFVVPSLALIVGIVIPNPRIGASINLFQQVLAALAFQQLTSYVIVAVDPASHIAMWFAVYVVVSVLVAFLTNGIVTKLALYFFNYMMVTEYHGGALPKGETDPYVFAGRFAISILIGAGIGIVAPFFPYPRTHRDDAERALKAAYHGIAICFGGVTASVCVGGPRPGVQRRVNARRITAARASVEHHLHALEVALEGMRFEVHSAELHDRLAARLAVAREAMSGIDGLHNLVGQITRTPNIIDKVEPALRWGRWMAPKLAEAANTVEDFCVRAGDVEYVMVPADLDTLERMRDGVRTAFESARQRTILSGSSTPMRRAASLNNFPPFGGGTDGASTPPPAAMRAAHTTSGEEDHATDADLLTATGLGGGGGGGMMHAPSATDFINMYEASSGQSGGHRAKYGGGIFPFLHIGYFALSTARFMRTLASLSPDEELARARSEPAVVLRKDEVATVVHDTRSKSPAAKAATPPASGSSIAVPVDILAAQLPSNASMLAPYIPATAKADSVDPPSPTSAATTSPGATFPSAPDNDGNDADTDDAASAAPTRDNQPDNASFAVRVRRSPLVVVDPIEPIHVRMALYWPRCWLGGFLQFRSLCTGDAAVWLKLREAVKLVFAMSTALAIILAFATELPAGGAATIAFVKDANAAATMVASLDYIGSTITGSVYGFIAVSIAQSQGELTAYMCVIVAVLSYVRSHPRYATPAFLATFFAVSAMAPGIADTEGLLSTVKQNVLAMTWLVVTHAFMWPIWPHQQVRDGMIEAVGKTHTAVTMLLEAIECTDPAKARTMAWQVAALRGPLRQQLGELRASVHFAAREPTLRRTPFTDREHLRVLDALDAVASLLFPVASAAAYINELPVPRQASDSGRRAQGVDGNDDTSFVPLKVMQSLRKDTDNALEDVDRMFRALRSLWGTNVDVSDTLLQALADTVASLEVCVRDGSRVYLAHLENSMDARPYEMSAINTIMHFYSTLSGGLNYLVEASVDAHRAAVASGLVD